VASIRPLQLLLEPFRALTFKFGLELLEKLVCQLPCDPVEQAASGFGQLAAKSGVHGIVENGAPLGLGNSTFADPFAKPVTPPIPVPFRGWLSDMQTSEVSTAPRNVAFTGPIFLFTMALKPPSGDPLGLSQLGIQRPSVSASFKPCPDL
jgi:hypothetical protein